MALSGSTGSNVGSYWRLELDWSATQNIGGNYSDVSVSLYWVSTRSTSGVSSSASKSGYIIIDGTRTNFTATAGVSGNQRKRIATASKRVSHGSDGAKSFSISANFGMAVTLSGTYYGSKTISGTWSLNTIPRKTEVSLGNSTANFGSSIRINFDRKSSSFTHTVSYSFVGKSEVIWDKITWANADWTVPLSLMSQVPNATSNWGTINVDTYNGSTNIGRTSVRFTLNVPSNIIPSFSSLTASEANTTVSSAGIGAYIQGMSNIKLTINGASGTYGSTIKSYSINFDGQVKGNNGIWNPTFTGSKTATATITDSRGRTANKSISIAVIGYSPPVISNVSVSRVQADTTKVSVIREGSISSLNGKNQVRVIVDSSPKGTNTWSNASESLGAVGSTTFGSTVTLPNSFDLTKSFDIRIRAIDKFNTVTTIASLSSAFYTVSLGKRGIGVGKTWEKGSLDVEGDAYFSGGITIQPRGTDIPRFQLHSKDSNGHSYIEFFGSDGVRKGYMGIPSVNSGALTINSESDSVNIHGDVVRINGAEVIERGSNSTGEWMKFYDGTQITYCNFMWNPDTGSQYVNIPLSYGDSPYMTFVGASNSDLYSVEETSQLSAGRNNGYQVRVARGGAKVRTDLTWSVQASLFTIGRWK